MHQARGTFDVKVVPVPADAGDAAGFGRLTLNKVFHGDIDGTSAGVMIGAHSAVKGSGGYVALELVNAVLDGKRGTFVLQHNGTMQGGKFQLNVVVVPDSGTGELAGIDGSLAIIIAADGAHSYEFNYTLQD